MTKSTILQLCAICGGEPQRISADAQSFHVECVRCHNHTDDLESFAVADAVWNHLQVLALKYDRQPILPELPLPWSKRIEEGQAGSEMDAMAQELADWGRFSKDFRGACTVDRRLAGYDRLVNLARAVSSGASWSQTQAEAAEVLRSVHCSPELTHTEDTQRRLLSLLSDLMRFECVLTPDGKSEMYASSTGPYVWFDHVTGVISSPLSAQSRNIASKQPALN